MESEIPAYKHERGRVSDSHFFFVPSFSRAPAHHESRWLYVLWILLAFVLMLLKRIQTSDGEPQPAFVSTGNQITEPRFLMEKKAGSSAISASWHLDTFRGLTAWVCLPTHRCAPLHLGPTGSRPGSHLPISSSSRDTWASLPAGKVVAMHCTKCGTESMTAGSSALNAAAQG